MASARRCAITDPRLLRALALLRQVAGGADSSGASPESFTDPFSVPSAAAGWLPSSTDLLVPWRPEPLGPGASLDDAALWDAYFGELGDLGDLETGTPRDATFDAPLAELAAEAAGAANEAEVVLTPAEREAIGELVYDLLHRLEARDVDGAMACFREDFQALETLPGSGDDSGTLPALRAIDRDALRQRVEHALDSVGDDAIELVPAKVPQPLGHPLGALVALDLAVDRAPADGGRPTTRRHEVVLVLARCLEPTDEPTWLVIGGALFPA
ncbi:MAG: hypothetical protein AAGC60_19495 [Acidobacteriota bacterium]